MTDTHIYMNAYIISTYILTCDVQFLIGARSNNFAEIFEGLYFSVRKSVSLLGLLVFLILFWWVAYCLTCPGPT